mgnify:CR=1 FL=1
MSIDSEACPANTTPRAAEEKPLATALEPLDRALFSEALHRANGAAVALRDAQAEFAAAAQYRRGINAMLAHKYALDDASIVNPVTGEIVRPATADKSSQSQW